MKLSVIVTTYNAVRPLELVLCGIARQTRAPDEVLIADDGSGPETARLVESWRARLPVPLRHVWQVDRGFRKGRIANEAAGRAAGDQLIFLDGDAIPHRRFVDDHARLAATGKVLCGRRVRLGPKLSPQVDPELVRRGRLESLFGPVARSALTGDTARFTLGIRLPTLLARCFHPRSRKLMGVNFSLPRSAFARVNGYDERWGNWGEDRDLELRLRRSGMPFYPLLNRAVVYHLHHETRAMTPATRELLAAAERSDRTWCEAGLDAHGAFDPDA